MKRKRNHRTINGNNLAGLLSPGDKVFSYSFKTNDIMKLFAVPLILELFCSHLVERREVRELCPAEPSGATAKCCKMALGGSFKNIDGQFRIITFTKTVFIQTLEIFTFYKWVFGFLLWAKIRLFVTNMFNMQSNLKKFVESI